MYETRQLLCSMFQGGIFWTMSGLFIFPIFPSIFQGKLTTLKLQGDSPGGNKMGSTTATSATELFLEKFPFPVPDFVKWQAKALRFSPMAYICEQGGYVDDVKFLISGEVLVVNHFPDGNSFAFTSERALTTLGDIEVLSGKMTYASSVTAKTEALLITVNVETFLRWLDKDISFFRWVTRALAIKSYSIATHQGVIKYQSADQRIANILYTRAKQQLNKRNVTVIPYSHVELAQMSGMSERTVNRVLHKFREENIVQTAYGKLLISRDGFYALGKMLTGG